MFARKVGKYKNFLKVLDQNSPAFHRLFDMFPKLSSEKIKAAILNGPNIRKLVKDKRFSCLLSENELKAWNNVKVVTGSVRADNDAFAHSVSAMFEAFCNIDVRISVELYYLHSHLNLFYCDLQKVSNKHSKRFHQTISNFELRFWNTL